MTTALAKQLTDNLEIQKWSVLKRQSEQLQKAQALKQSAYQLTDKVAASFGALALVSSCSLVLVFGTINLMTLFCIFFLSIISFWASGMLFCYTNLAQKIADKHMLKKHKLKPLQVFKVKSDIDKETGQATVWLENVFTKQQIETRVFGIEQEEQCHQHIVYLKDQANQIQEMVESISIQDQEAKIEIEGFAQRIKASTEE